MRATNRNALAQAGEICTGCPRLNCIIRSGHDSIALKDEMRSVPRVRCNQYDEIIKNFKNEKY